MLLGSEERHRALDDALDTARVIGARRRQALGRGRGALRRRARARSRRFAPESPWLALLAKPELAEPREPAPRRSS